MDCVKAESDSKPYKRYVYGYNWANNRQPVYTGSTWDVKTRDKQHQLQADIDFDRLLASYGREMFMLEVLETVEAESSEKVLEACVERERFWILARRTHINGMNCIDGFSLRSAKAGSRGGKSRSAAKISASSANMLKAQAARRKYPPCEHYNNRSHRFNPKNGKCYACGYQKPK